MARAVLEEGKRVSIKQLNETIFVKAKDEETARIIMAENKKTMIFCENILHAENFSQYIPGSEICHSKRTPKQNKKALTNCMHKKK